MTSSSSSPTPKSSTAKSPSGVQLGGTGLKRLHRGWRQRPRGRLALLLDNVASPFNVGSMVRTAAAFGVDRVFLAGDTAPLDGQKTQKTALGTGRFLEWEQHRTGVEAVRAAQEAGYAVVALELTGDARPLHEVDLTVDVCLVVGHEDRGLSPAVVSSCDAVAFIPQLGKVGSLNVSIAAGIGCFEVRRQGWSETTGEPA